MSARECRCVHCRPKEPGEIMGPWRAEDNCYSCDGTGKVWPSVDGEDWAETLAVAYTGRTGTTWCVDLMGMGMLVVPGPGRYKVIVQKVGE